MDRGTAGPGVAAPPDVSGENVAFVPPATQSEAASDLFVTNDLSCIPFGLHTQILDGNGGLIGPPRFVARAEALLSASVWPRASPSAHRLRRRLQMISRTSTGA